MKKIALFLLGAVSLIVLLTQVGSLIGLIVSLAILYFAFKRFNRADSTGGKVLWAIVGIIALCFSISNVPAIIGIIALAGLYFVYKAWNNEKAADRQPSDPFDHFEKEWKEFSHK
ncbi:flagellar basal body rod protein [Sporolactobacillus sp. STCC-11]|uniref:lmo0954 family membrane protein n=1 Tax=Sporolactobacillus caesalpiniae TaxID=3230362 RepID=UPI00339774C3